MRFPNAAVGVKRIFIAEILSLIAAVISFIAVIVGVGGVAAGLAAGSAGGALGAGAGMLMLVAASGVLVIIGFIMNIVGIVNASKDEESFKTAIICLLVGIITSLIGSFLSGVPVAAGICNVISKVADLAVTILVITGIMKLAERLHNPAMVQSGSSQIKMIAVMYICSIVGSLIASLASGVIGTAIAGVISIVAGILGIIVYIVYLVYLSKAKDMLAQGR